MDEIRNITDNAGENTPSFVLNSISKLTASIKKLSKEVTSQEKLLKTPELQFLINNCGHANSFISLSCADGLESIITEQCLDLDTAFNTLLATLPTAKSTCGIVLFVKKMLLEHLQLNGKSRYKCPFGFTNHQHPLITILIQRNNSWPEVIDAIQEVISTKNIDYDISFELLKPPIIFILCDWNRTEELVVCRQQLWRIFLNILSESNSSNQLNIFYTFMDMLQWMKMSSISPQYLSPLLCDLIDTTVRHSMTHLSSCLVPYITCVATLQIKRGLKPSLQPIKQILSINQEMGNIVSILIVDTLRSCHASALVDIIELCTFIIDLGIINPITVSMLKAQLLQWISFLSHLIPTTVMEDILTLLDRLSTYNSSNYSLTTNVLNQNIHMKHLLSYHDEIKNSIEISILSDELYPNEMTVLTWLNLFTIGENFVYTDSIIPFLCGIFLHPWNNSKIIISTLKVLVHLVKVKRDLAPSILTLLLHKLTVKNAQNAWLDVLYAVPAMGINKICVPVILPFLDSLGKVVELKPLQIQLTLELWKVQDRCYPFLQKLLVQSTPTGNYEIGIARASAIAYVCKKKSDLYGEDLLSALSEILNESIGHEGSVACVYALQGIYSICESGIMDLCSTWNALSPRFCKDKRPIVLKEFFKLLELIALMGSDSIIEDKLCRQNVMFYLWKIVNHADEFTEDLVQNTFKILSCFPLESFLLRMLPDICSDDLILPPELAKTPMEAARKPKDVMDYIPCECWIKFLLNLSPLLLPYGSDLLVAFVKGDVDNLVVGSETKSGYSHLPVTSVLRGILNYVHHELGQPKQNKSTYPVLLKCLNILSQDFSHPLPKLDWTILHKLKEDEGRICVIDIICKQCQTSRSARAMVEVALNTMTQNGIINEHLLRNLHHICKGVPPNILQSHLEAVLNMCVEKAVKDDDAGNLIFVFSCIEKALTAKPAIPDANLCMLAILVENNSEKIPMERKITWSAYVSCAKELPLQNLHRLTSPSMFWELEESKFRKSTMIRCTVALQPNSLNPLVWTNEIIEALANESVINTDWHMDYIAQVVLRYSHCCQEWLWELMGQLLSVLVGRCKLQFNSKQEKEKAVAVLCDVFVTSVVLISGVKLLHVATDTFVTSRKEYCNVLPLAISSLLCKAEFQPQKMKFMDWLLHINAPTHADLLNEEIKKAFLYTFICMYSNIRPMNYTHWAKWIGTAMQCT